MIVIIVIVVLAILSIGGWLVSKYVLNRVAEETAESIFEGATGGEVDIDSSGENVSFSSEDGSFSVSGDKTWPTDMPSSVPEFKYGTVEASSKSSSDDGSGWTVSLVKVKAGAYDSYKQDLVGASWTESGTITSEMKMANMENDEYYLTFTVDESDNTGSLIVTVK